MSHGGRAAAAVSALRPGARWIAVAAVAGAVAGLLWGLSDRPSYRATASVVVVDRGEDAEVAGGGAVGTAGGRESGRLAELARSEAVATSAAALLGDDVPGADLLARSSFTVTGGGSSLVIRSTASSADLAAAAADAFGAAIIEVTGQRERRRLRAAERQLRERLAPLDPASAEAVELEGRVASVVALAALGDPLEPGREAELPTAPRNDRPVVRSMLIGAAVGAALALLAVLVRGLLVPPRGRAEMLAAALGAPRLPPLERVAERAHAQSPGAVGLEGRLTSDLSAVALATGLEDAEGLRRTVAVTGLRREAGLSDVAVGLAALIAARGRRVALLEADIEHPVLASLLGVANEPGLAQHFAGVAGPREVMRTIRVEGAGSEEAFVCVPAGGGDGYPSDSAGVRMAALVDRLQRLYDLVIVICSPLLEGPDGAAVATAADGTIVCTGSAAFSSRDAEHGARLLSDARVLGILPLSPAAD